MPSPAAKISTLTSPRCVRARALQHTHFRAERGSRRRRALSVSVPFDIARVHATSSTPTTKDALGTARCCPADPAAGRSLGLEEGMPRARVGRGNAVVRRGRRRLPGRRARTSRAEQQARARARHETWRRFPRRSARATTSTACTSPSTAQIASRAASRGADDDVATEDAQRAARGGAARAHGHDPGAARGGRGRERRRDESREAARAARPGGAGVARGRGRIAREASSPIPGGSSHARPDRARRSRRRWRAYFASTRMRREPGSTWESPKHPISRRRRGAPCGRRRDLAARRRRRRRRARVRPPSARAGHRGSA